MAPQDIATTSSNTNARKSSSNAINNITFLHLDLGIGGAESLILQLAIASDEVLKRQSATTNSSTTTTGTIDIYTTRCDQDHCYDAFNHSKNGKFAKNVHVHGNFIPATLFGKGRALLSNLRMIYLTFMVIFHKYRHSSSTTTPDIIVIDVLPIPIPILLHFLFPNIAILFYCHFPDQLLVQNTNTRNAENNAIQTLLQHPNSTTATINSDMSMYRKFMNSIENYCIQYSDIIVCNSKFTKSIVEKVFPFLISNHNTIEILYPSLDTNEEDEEEIAAEQETQNDNDEEPIVFVSLNRYERKKNIELVLYSYSEYLKRYQKEKGDVTNIRKRVKIIIAGGYDTQVMENVEYRNELQRIATQDCQLQVKRNTTKDEDYDVEFVCNLSDHERNRLLKESTCVVYTPSNEHFGIVPLEAMYAGTCVIGINNGGPKETIIHNETGYLCDPANTIVDMSLAMEKIIENFVHAQTMGINGKRHVVQNFSKHNLYTKWSILLQTVIVKSNERKRNALLRQSSYSLYNSIKYLIEAILILLFCIILTKLLQSFNILHPNQSIVGYIRAIVFGVDNDDEL